MAKAKGRKSSGAAGIAIIDEDPEHHPVDMSHEVNGQSDANARTAKPGRIPKAKPTQQSNENLGISEIKKAAAFANSMGGLDKAIAVLQILKVAKEVQ